MEHYGRTDMALSRRRKLFRLMLGLAIVVSSGILLTLVIARGGSLTGAIRVKEFSLCQATTAGGRPQPLSSLVLTPTTIIYACGYLETEGSFIGRVYLRYYLNRGLETVFEPDSDYSLPFHSQYFSIPISTPVLLTPGEYRLYVFELGARSWLESVRFEISPSPN